MLDSRSCCSNYSVNNSNLMIEQQSTAANPTQNERLGVQSQLGFPTNAKTRDILMSRNTSMEFDYHDASEEFANTPTKQLETSCVIDDQNSKRT